MKKQSIYTTICLVLSSVVGAGFVGGKEVEKYFQGNVWGVIVFSAMLLFALACLVLLCKSYNIDSINSLSKLLFGRLSLAYLWATSLALLCIVIALFGTANDCFKAVFDVKTNYPVGQLATALICFPLVKHGKKAIEKAAKFLLPICVVFIICAWISKGKTTITSTGFSLLNITIYT